MKIREIKKIHVKIFQDNNCIYTGMIEEISSDLLDVDIKELSFDCGSLIIKI